MPQPSRRFSLSTTRGVAGSMLRFWQQTYAPDYVGVIILAVTYILMENLVTPFHRLFRLDDPDIQFPHALVERVPLPALFGYAGAIPIALILAWGFASKSSFHKMHVAILGFFIGLVLTSVLTDLIKNAVGRPRPDLIDRCRPLAGTPIHEFVTVTVCTQAGKHTLNDGWRSFPSGHSSFAFAGLGFLAMFLAGQLHVFRPEGDLLSGLIALVPLLGAALIAISRCEDYRHDVYDVTCGSILGLLVALGSYRRFYPPLTSRSCDVPYPSRSDVKAWSNDEESGNHNGMAFNLEELDRSDVATDAEEPLL